MCNIVWKHTHIHKTFLRQLAICMVQDSVISDLTSTLPALKCRMHMIYGGWEVLKSDIMLRSKVANSVVSVWFSLGHFWKHENSSLKVRKFETQEQLMFPFESCGRKRPMSQLRSSFHLFSRDQESTKLSMHVLILRRTILYSVYWLTDSNIKLTQNDAYRHTQSIVRPRV